MKKQIQSLMLASLVLGTASAALAGAYGEKGTAEEIPAAAPSGEEAAGPVMRRSDGFVTDAETARGLYAEVGSLYAEEYHPTIVGDAQFNKTWAQLAYGREMWEVGVALPSYEYLHQEGVGTLKDFTDLRLWAKVLPIRTKLFTFGGGLVVTFPTAGSGLGTDEYGFEPFVTGAVQAGPASIRYSGGYNVYTAPSAPLAKDTFDSFDENLAVLAPVCEHVVLRTELTHQHLTVNDGDPVMVVPGADVRFDLGNNVDLLLRPSVGVGITEAPDWQVGLGLAVNAGGL